MKKIREIVMSGRKLTPSEINNLNQQELQEMVIALQDLRATEGETAEEWEYRYKTLFDKIDEGFCIAEVLFDDAGNANDYRFLEVNSTFERQTGITGAEGRRIREFIPELENSWYDAFGEIVKTGNPARFLNYASDLDRWFDVFAFPFGENGDNQVGILFQNVTEREKAGQALRESEQRFRALVISGSQVVYRMNHDWSQMQQLVGQGFIKDTLAPNPNWMDDYIHPEDKEDVIRAINQAIENKSTFFLEHRVLTRDGALGWTSSRAVPLLDQDGNIHEWIGSAIDITEKKGAEQALQQSEQRFKALVLSGSNIVYRMNPDWSTMEMVQGQDFLNLTSGPVATWLEDFIPVPERERVIKATNHALENKTAFSLEHRIFFADGSIGWIFSRAVPLLDKKGNISEWIGSASDITEKKHAEQALRESEQRFRALVVSGSNMVYRMNHDWSEMWQLTGQGFLKDTVQPNPHWTDDHLLPEDKQMVMQTISEAIKNKTTYSLEHRFFTREGSVGWTFSRAVPILDQEGNIREWIGSAVDITEKKLAEQSLRKSEQRFRALVTSGSSSVFRISHDFSNAELLSGMDLFAHTGKSTSHWLESFVYPEDHARVFSAIEFAMEQKSIFNIEHRINGPNNKQLWILSKAVPILDENGQISEWFGSATDITQKRKTDQIQRRAQALEAAYKELESFSYSVSHDLRSPLTSIMGFIMLLGEDYADKLDETGRDYLDRIKASAEKMDAIINSLLILSRASSRKMDPEKTDLSHIANSVLKDLKNEHSKRKVEVIIQDDMVAHADNHLMNIVFTNLIGNAWKFTSKTSNARIEAGTVILDNQQVFFVRDNGSGFDKSQAETIFSPFKRAHSEVEFPGSGIGLAIVERIIKRHGGHIWAESSPGEGAIFYFTLG